MMTKSFAAALISFSFLTMLLPAMPDPAGTFVSLAASGNKDAFRPVPAPRSAAPSSPSNRIAPLPSTPVRPLNRPGDPYALCKPRCERACERLSCSGLNGAQCTTRRHTCRQGCASKC